MKLNLTMHLGKISLFTNEVDTQLVHFIRMLNITYIF